MKMNQKGKGNDYFETPDYLYNQLNSIFNFTCDVACDAVNSKARFSITEKENSISPECGWVHIDAFVIRRLVKNQNLSRKLIMRYYLKIVRYV